MMPGFSESPPTIADLLREAATRLEGESARREAEWLAEHALGVNRAWLFSHAGDLVDARACQRYAALIERRASGEPLAYILGHTGFWTLDLEVTPATLIPRSETELLVEAALARLPASRTTRVADLGTGSGAIALAIAGERPNATVVATDASTAALEVAARNAIRNTIANVEFRHGDWLAPLRGERFDLIASNPPYIADGDPHLARGDLRFEPAMALSCGVEGLDAIRQITRDAPAHLLPGGWLVLEHGLDQGPGVRAILGTAGFSDVHTLCDLEQRERVTLGRITAAPG